MEELNERINKLREKIEKKRKAYITLMDNAEKNIFRVIHKRGEIK
jgi:hypothetical protein